jgi:hypothetical protein
VSFGTGLDLIKHSEKPMGGGLIGLSSPDCELPAELRHNLQV